MSRVWTFLSKSSAARRSLVARTPRLEGTEENQDGEDFHAPFVGPPRPLSGEIASRGRIFRDDLEDRRATPKTTLTHGARGGRPCVSKVTVALRGFASQSASVVNGRRLLGRQRAFPRGTKMQSAPQAPQLGR